MDVWHVGSLKGVVCSVVVVGKSRVTVDNEKRNSPTIFFRKAKGSVIITSHSRTAELLATFLTSSFAQLPSSSSLGSESSSSSATFPSSAIASGP